MKFKTTAGLQRTIDHNFRRMREAAQEEWQRRFSGKDASDGCVSIRITAIHAPSQSKGVPAGGFLKPSKRSRRDEKTKDSLPRFAH